MAKKKKKQKIKIYFRDGKKDIIPQKLWTDYDFIAKIAEHISLLSKMNNGLRSTT